MNIDFISSCIIYYLSLTQIACSIKPSPIVFRNSVDLVVQQQQQKSLSQLASSTTTTFNREKLLRGDQFVFGVCRAHSQWLSNRLFFLFISMERICKLKTLELCDLCLANHLIYRYYILIR